MNEGGDVRGKRKRGKKDTNQEKKKSKKDKTKQTNKRNEKKNSKKDETEKTNRDENTIFVSNFSKDTTEADLQDLFSPFGRISRVILAKGRKTMQLSPNRLRSARGFAFISFVHHDDASRAMAKLQGFRYGHLALKLEWDSRGKRDAGTEREKKRKKASSETGQPKDKKAGYESGDSYDSGDNLVRNVDDDNFLDLDDDDEDLLKEYNEDQNFNDERGVGSSKAKKGKKRSAGGGEKLSGARASDMDNPVMQAMSRMKRQKVKEKSVEELEQSAIEFVTLMDTIADTDEKSNTGQTKPKEAQKKMENQSDSSSVVSSESEDESDEESVVQQPKNNKQTNKKEKATFANPAGKNKTKTSSETTTSTRTSTSTSTTTTTTNNNNNNTHSLIRLPLHLATHNPVPPSFPPVSNLPFPSTVDSTRYEISTGLVVPTKSSLPVTSPRGHSALTQMLKKPSNLLGI
ncbi:hypothetical protein TrCOL_g8109 [Triparma columacea]|uniref:RRM domain-containing protein n=1 Tax=Triparma columacea TaxID=722753 RepID=A0A9W7GFH2_9STRA|nr:hypothetical protein TrCOL_g8109 [Triparma columacea]